MKTPKIKTLIYISLCTLLFLILSLGSWFFLLEQEIAEKLEAKKFLPPTYYYSAPAKITSSSSISLKTLLSHFDRHQFRKRTPDQPLKPGDFAIWDPTLCQSRAEIPPETTHCVAYIPHTLTEKTQVIGLTTGRQVAALFSGDPLEPVDFVLLEPELFAQYLGKQPIFRKPVSLGETPTQCLNALLAIEDPYFLEHSGVRPTSLIRATFRNLREGRYAEGGSTITQQLVKNYFLTSKKTLKRKFTELAMSLILEMKMNKDLILETYINLIYLGANNAFQIRGFSAAAEFYFNKHLKHLNLPECALLAAIINNPGRFNPFKHPERAINRRTKVLTQMVKYRLLIQEEADRAQNFPLPTLPQIKLSEPAPFFVQAVRKQLEKLEIDSESGLKVYTTLNIENQKAARDAVQINLEALESHYLSLQKKRDDGKILQALLVAADLSTGHIQALIGGRNYRQSQFNRATQSKRQVGSIMKPFVYLSALESLTTSGDSYNPLTPLEDKPFTHTYDKQKWSPKNYSGKYHGTIPLYYGLKNSLNIPTAKLGLTIGVDSIVDVARRLGVHSPIQGLPSLTLGAYELTPQEVLQAYTTIARMGSSLPLTLITRVNTLKDESLFEHHEEPEQVFDASTAAVLVGMMKETVESGTARALRRYFQFPIAGKTGTTSDNHDAWFLGFTPTHIAMAWVGYDDNSSHGLTGASGAIPIWKHYFQKSYHEPSQDFSWPENTTPFRVKASKMKNFTPSELKDPNFEIELIFRQENTPSFN